MHLLATKSFDRLKNEIILLYVRAHLSKIFLKVVYIMCKCFPEKASNWALIALKMFLF